MKVSLTLLYNNSRKIAVYSTRQQMYMFAFTVPEVITLMLTWINNTTCYAALYCMHLILRHCKIIKFPFIIFITLIFWYVLRGFWKYTFVYLACIWQLKMHGGKCWTVYIYMSTNWQIRQHLILKYPIGGVLILCLLL